MRLLFLLVYLALATMCSAQSVLDSLIRALPGLAGKERINALSDISWELGQSDAARAIGYASEGVKLAEVLGDSLLVAIAVNDLAIATQRKGEYQRAIQLNLRAFRIRETANDSLGMAGSLSKLGTLYQETGRFIESQANQYAALSIYDAAQDVVHGAQTRGNLARLYELQGDTTAALRVAEEAVNQLRGKDNTYALAMALGQLSQILLTLKLHDRSTLLGEEAMRIFQRIGAKNEIAILANNMGVIQHDLKNFDRSIAYYQQALASANEMGEWSGIAHYAANVGNELVVAGRPIEAIRFFKRSLSICRQERFIRPMIMALSGLAGAFEKVGNMREALSAQKELTVFKDSVYNVERLEQLSDMQVKYETERTEKELLQERTRTEVQRSEIAQQRLHIVALGGGLGSLALIGAVVVLIQRAGHKGRMNAQVIAERDRGLKAVIDSTEAERRRLAGELHDGVGQQLAGLRFQLDDVATRIVERAPDEKLRVSGLISALDEASRDVRGIAHNLRPRALDDLGLAPALGDMLHKALDRPGFTLSYEHFGLDARLPQHVEVGVYRIAQELVNNIIKHAEARTVNVQLFKNKGNLVLLVEDDGKGMGDHARKGLGLLSMHDRARAMNGLMDFSDAPENGTIVTLRLPLSNGNISHHA